MIDLQILKRFRRQDNGSVLAEFALTSAFIILLGLVVFDFSWFFMRMALAEYAAQIAVRTAVVRPPVCPGVPDTIDRNTDFSNRFGTLCSDAPGACNLPTVQCNGGADPTTAEILAKIGPFLPAGATGANLEFTYAAPPADSIGFLGGPYVPIVSVSLVGLQHDFILPVGSLFGAWYGGGGGDGVVSVNLGPLTATMPGEDLNVGTAG